MTSPLIHAALVALGVTLGAMTLSGCIDSAAPLLTDAKPVLGHQFKFQAYALRKGYASDPEQASFRWDGKRYVHAAGGMKDVESFTVHPFEGGTFIIQSTPMRDPKTAEYAAMRPLADGVYRVFVIDEAHADAAIRQAHCSKQGGTACRVTTREQLFAFARATAAHHKGDGSDGGLAIRLAD